MAKQEQAAQPAVGSAFDLVGKSIDIVKNNWIPFVVVNIFVILGAISQAANPDGEVKTNDDGFYFDSGSGVNELSGLQLGSLLGAGLVIGLIIAAVAVFLYVMATSLEVKAAAGKKPDVKELFEDGKKYFFRFIGLMILGGLIILAGFVLLIVPGIFAIGRLAMAPYHMIDKNLGVVEALKQSNEQAKGRMILVYAAIGVMILIAIAAGILNAIPVLGPLVATAITIATSLILALRYQQLKKAPKVTA